MNMTIRYFVIICQESFESLLLILPYLLIGTIVGELLKLISWRKLTMGLLSRNSVFGNFISGVLGVTSPLCTYGTVPVVIQLYKAGVSLAPLTVFLSASAMMNPQLFIMTSGNLGWDLAILRVVSALVFGLLLGIIMKYIPEKWVVKSTIELDVKLKNEIESSKKEFNLKIFIINVLKSLEYVGLYVVIGVLLGVVVEKVIPSGWMSIVFKSNKFLSVLFSSLLGVPLYACGGGAIPFIRSMMDSGMGKGAVLAFFMVGSATRIPPLSALLTILRPKFVAIYVGALLVYSIVLGTIY